MASYAIEIPVTLIIEVEAEAPDVAMSWAKNTFSSLQPYDPLGSVHLPDGHIGDNQITDIEVKTAVHDADAPIRVWPV